MCLALPLSLPRTNKHLTWFPLKCTRTSGPCDSFGVFPSCWCVPLLRTISFFLSLFVYTYIYTYIYTHIFIDIYTHMYITHLAALSLLRSCNCPANLSSAEDTQGHDADTPTSRPAECRAALALFQVPSRLFKRLRHTGGVMQTHSCSFKRLRHTGA